MSRYVVRKLTKHEIPSAIIAINQLLQELSTSGRETTIKSLQRSLDHLSVVIACDTNTNNIIGMGVVRLDHQLGRSISTIEDVVVTKSYRGRGVSSLIMEELEGIAFHEHKVTRIELHTTRSDAASVYKRRGYKEYPTQVFRKGL